MGGGRGGDRGMGASDESQSRQEDSIVKGCTVDWSSAWCMVHGACVTVLVPVWSSAIRSYTNFLVLQSR